MQILGLLGMYFDAAVVFVTNSSLLFRLTMAILCFQKSLGLSLKSLRSLFAQPNIPGNCVTLWKRPVRRLSAQLKKKLVAFLLLLLWICRKALSKFSSLSHKIDDKAEATYCIAQQQRWSVGRPIISQWMTYNELAQLKFKKKNKINHIELYRGMLY